MKNLFMCIILSSIFSYKDEENDLPNELHDGITSVCKTFVDGTSLFSKANDKNSFNTQNNKQVVFSVEDVT